MRFLVLAVIVQLSVVAQSQTGGAFMINGTVRGMETGKIYLSEFVINGKRDSTFIQNGKFRFTGNANQPTPYILSLERNFVNRPLLMFFAEKGSIEIVVKADDIRKSTVNGPRSQQEYVMYQQRIQPFAEAIDKLADRRQHVAKDDQLTMDSITRAWEAQAAKKKEAEREFIKDHPNSVVSAWVITRSFIYQPDLNMLESLYNGLTPAVQATSYARSIRERLELENRVAVGRPALDFSQEDTLGKMVSLKDFRGKYVLVDFWASWCGPCRAENPNVVKAFNAYKDKNFTVLGVSLDRPGKKDAWLDAIHKDNLTWTHVSDLKYWDNEAAKLYGINAVPSNFLIDPSGKIIARNLEGEGLMKKLDEVLK